MRIALRPSGGRGEYELAGRQGAVSSSDLFDIPISLEFAPEVILPTFTVARRMSGKPRIRTFDTGIHAYRIIAAVLLLPTPIREIRRTGDNPILLKIRGYAMSSIGVDISAVTAHEIVLRPTQIRLENLSGASKRLSLAERMSRVMRIWEAAGIFDTDLGMVLREHQRSVIDYSENPRLLETAASAVYSVIGTELDVLPAIERELQISDTEMDQSSLLLDETEETPELDDTSPVEAKRRQIMQWRLQATRGANGRKFSQRVKLAYDYRCLFTGLRLPKTPRIAVPGVDAAHILPWRVYELDSLRNGICISKLCHWAFDNGLLRLDFDEGERTYFVSVPEESVREAEGNRLDIGCFLKLTGPIPIDRFPAKEQDWPSPKYLQELNTQLFGT